MGARSMASRAPINLVRLFYLLGNIQGDNNHQRSESVYYYCNCRPVVQLIPSLAPFREGVPSSRPRRGSEADFTFLDNELNAGNTTDSEKEPPPIIDWFFSI